VSDTPKTDAAVYLTRGPNFKAVCPNFARELERECAALKSELREQIKRHNADTKKDSQEIAAYKLKVKLLVRAGNGLAALLCSWCPKEVRGDSLMEWDCAHARAALASSARSQGVQS
jgi:hypothetical protein